MTGNLYTARPALIIELVEDALLERLALDVSGQLKVEAFPADPKTYDLDNLPAALLIHYSGSDYAQPKGPAGTAQARRMRYQLVLLTRSLRGQGGAYSHLEDVRLSVQGNTFAGAGPVTIVSDRLEEEKDGVWRWLVSIALPIPAVARTIQTSAPLMRPAFT